MDEWLQPAQALETEMGVGVTGEEHRLEENHDGVPDGGRATEEREEELADEGLDGKEKDRAEENGRPKGQRQGGELR